MLPQLERDILCPKIICISTPHSQGGRTSDLTSLGRTLDKELHKVIFDEQVASLALPFVGSRKASAVAVTAPFIIRQASTFLKIPHASQSLKGDHNCSSLAAAMQEHWLGLIQYIEAGALVMPAKQQAETVPASVLTDHHAMDAKLETSKPSCAATAASKQPPLQQKALQNGDNDQSAENLKAYTGAALVPQTQQADAAPSAAASAHNNVATDDSLNAKPRDGRAWQTMVGPGQGRSSSTVQHVDPVGPCLQHDQARVNTTGCPIINAENRAVLEQQRCSSSC